VASPNGAGASVAGHTVLSANSIFSDKPFAETVVDYVTSFQLVELILCIVGGLGLVIVSRFVVPLRERMVFYREVAGGDIILDPSNSQDVVEDTISDTVLLITCMLLPLFFQLGISIGFGYGNDGHKTFCIYCIGFGLTLFITGCLKNYCGVFRPNFYDACGFNEETLLCTVEEAEQIKYRKSFPSGHASFAFCGMALFTMYLRQTFANTALCEQEKQKREAIMSVRQRHIQQQQAMSSPSKLQWQQSLMRLKVVLCYLPMLYAIFVASTRIADNFHFPADVVAGSLIGMGCAAFTHDLWYPSNNLHVPITE